MAKFIKDFLENKNTGEIHRKAYESPRCEIASIKEDHAVHLSAQEVDSKLGTSTANGHVWNGCHWCFNERHTD